MNVYVESNFVLEHALEQEECETCLEIVRLAGNRQLKLVIPAFSLAEPHQAIFSKAKTRSRLGEDLRVQLGELGRSRRHREVPGTFDALAAALIASAQFEREGLRRAVPELIESKPRKSFRWMQRSCVRRRMFRWCTAWQGRMRSSSRLFSVTCRHMHRARAAS
jgi:hypothetical protein